jgi:leucyl aminopeptidase
MDIVVKNILEEEIKADTLIVPLFEDSSSEVYSALDSIIGGLIRKVVNSGEFTGKLNQITLLHVRNINPDRILLIGLGKQSDIKHDRIRQAGGKAFSYLRDIGIRDIAVSSIRFNNLSMSFTEKPIFYFIEGGLLGLYKFEKYKKSENSTEIKSVKILSDEKEIHLKRLHTVVSALNFARDLVNTPSNDMTPTAISNAAKSLSGKKVKVKVLEKGDAEKEGMGAYLSVSKGSAEPPKFIVVEYKGGKGNPLVLIGKTITFDSGGISLKPAEGMEKMKYDMAGGASVLAIIKAASEMALPVNIVGILPAAENLPSGSASKPGDIVKAITGKTIEIINTDAEGRLALADAIGYAIKYYKPRAVIDIATLTGACSIALGSEAIAMMGNNAEIMEKIKKASEDTYERVWQMPLYDEYKDYIKSDVADIKNSGGKNGSLVTAGYFLKEFASDTPWVHLDIAATAWNNKDKPYVPKGATGIGVRLMLSFLKEI